MRHFITFKGIDNGNDVKLDVSAICNSQNTEMKDPRCTTAFKSAAGTAAFTIGWTPDKVADPYDGTLIDRDNLYKTCIDAMLASIETKAEMQVRLLDDTRSDVLFRGYIDPSDISLARTKLPKEIKVSCKDHTTDLDKKIGLNIIREGVPVNELVEELLELCYGTGGHIYVGTGNIGLGTGQPGNAALVGVKRVVSSLPSSVVVDRFVITADESTTYRQAIDRLLHEKGVGYVLHYVHISNKFEIVPCIPAEVDDSQIRTVNFMADAQLVTRTGIYGHDGVIVKWPTIEERKDDNVYSEDIDLKYDGISETIGEIVQNGSYFPKDGDITETRQQFRRSDRAYVTGESRKQNNDIDLLYAKDAGFGVIAVPVKMTSRGTVANLDALEALTDPKLGDYAQVTSLSEYRGYNGSDWEYMDAPSLTDGKGNFYKNKGSVASKSALPVSPSAGDFYLCEDTGYSWCWVDSEWQRKISLFCFPVLSTPDVNMTDGNPAFYPRSMWALGRNRSGGMVNLQAASVTATSVARTKINKTTHPAIIKDPDEYEAVYVTEKTEAEAFALFLYNSHRIACTTCTWYEWDGQKTPRSRLGERVRVEYMTGSTAVFCVIQIDNLAITRKNRKFKITALLVSGFETSFSGRHESAVAPTVVNKRQAVSQIVSYANSDSGTTAPDTGWSDTRTIIKGKYLWTRTVTNFSDATSETTYTVVYNAVDGTTPELWDMKLSQTSAPRNDRDKTSITDITITPLISGHTVSQVKFICNGSKAYFGTTPGTKEWQGSPQPVTLHIPYSETYEEISITMQDMTSESTLADVTDVVKIINETVYDYDFGLWVSSVLPQYVDAPDNTLEVEDGDFFVVGHPGFTGDDGQSYKEGVPYVYDHTKTNPWHNPITVSTTKDVKRLLSCLGNVMGSDTVQPSEAAIYGWFGTLMTKTGIIESLFSQAITILSGGYIKGGDRYAANGDITNWNEEGFWFGSDGRLKAQLQSDDSTNTFVGTKVSGYTNTVGYANTAMGYAAMYKDKSGCNYNTAIGYMAMYNNEGGLGNVAIGPLALYSVTTGGDGNIAIGHDAQYHTTTGDNNVAVGDFAMSENRTGSENIGIGYQVMLNNTSGSNNIAIGYRTLYSNNSSDNNVAIGKKSLYTSTSGSENTAIGINVLEKTVSGKYNTGIGYYSLNKSLGNYNTCIGYSSASGFDNGADNTALGVLTMYYSGTKNGNTAIGAEALEQLGTGDYNVALGRRAFQLMTGGSYNVGIGTGVTPYSNTGSRQLNINGAFIGLEFKSGRTQSQVFTALSSYLTTTGQRVSCIGTIEGDSVTFMERYDSSTIYLGGGNTTHGISNSSTALTKRMVILFANPAMMSDTSADCLGS